jgi:hypothetical protein
MEDKQECEGCKAYRLAGADLIFCGLPIEKEGVPCPCLSCLVKSMCGDTICKLFADYLSLTWR